MFNLRILLELLRGQWNEPDLTEGELRSSLVSIQRIHCSDPTTCADHDMPRETSVRENNVFIHGSALLCEKKREVCFNLESMTTKGNADRKGLQQETTVSRSANEQLRHPSAAALATTHVKRRRSQGEEDVVRVKRFTSLDASSVNRSATATPTASDHNLGSNVSNLPSFVSTPSSAYHMAIDGGDAVFSSRPSAQHDGHNVQADSEAINTIRHISDQGINILMKSAYDHVDKLSYDICQTTKMVLFPRQILMNQSSNRLIVQLGLSLFNTNTRSESSDWRKSRLRRAFSLAADRVLCALIGAMVQSILLPGSDRESYQISFLPEFEDLIESVKHIVSAPHSKSATFACLSSQITEC